MPTKIILNKLDLPVRGPVNFNIDCSFEIAVTAEEARRKVKRWLLDEISMMMTAETPTVVIDAHKTVWRVPAILTATHIGYAGVAGKVDVDIQTGEMNVADDLRDSIRNGARSVAAKLPPYTPRSIADVPTESIAKDYQPTIIQPHGSPAEIVAGLQW